MQRTFDNVDYNVTREAMQINEKKRAKIHIHTDEQHMHDAPFVQI